VPETDAVLQLFSDPFPEKKNVCLFFKAIDDDDNLSSAAEANVVCTLHHLEKSIVFLKVFVSPLKVHLNY
jgi:hypothetical protein